MVSLNFGECEVTQINKNQLICNFTTFPTIINQTLIGNVSIWNQPSNQINIAYIEEPVSINNITLKIANNAENITIFGTSFSTDINDIRVNLQVKSIASGINLNSICNVISSTKNSIDCSIDWQGQGSQFNNNEILQVQVITRQIQTNFVNYAIIVQGN